MKLATLTALALLACTACGPTTRASSLPTDLPPPEYETPRGLDLAPKKAAPAPSEAPAPATPPAAAPPKAP